MTSTKELILEIKKIVKDENLTPADMKRMLEEIGEIPLSDATFSRLLEDGSEDNRKFHYDNTLAPLARALRIDVIDASDSKEVKALKEMLRIVQNQNKELEKQLDREKIRRHEQLDEVREQSRITIEFLKEQVSYKDKRMDEFSDRIARLLDRIETKDDRIEKLTSEILALKDLKEAYQHCPYKVEHE